MRCAAFTVTAHGVELAEKLKEAGIGSVDVFVKEGKPAPDDVKYYSRLADAVGEAFGRYDALIFFSAIGIVVRLIAPHLQSKLLDPAVIVVDDRSRHAISLLSGHVGGANALTYQIAGVLRAQPIVTTATDVNKLVAPDVIATELGLKPHPKSMIERINSNLLAHKPIAYYIDKAFTRAEFFRQKLGERGIESELLTIEEAVSSNRLAVFITPRAFPLCENLMYLHPRRLIAGIGCRRGVPEDEIRNALSAACELIGQEISAVSLIASTVVKADEEGILNLAEHLQIPTRFFENKELEEKIEEYDLDQSEFVRGKIGVGNVCGAAAISCVERGQFALEKTKFKKVTVALVWEK